MNQWSSLFLPLPRCTGWIWIERGLQWGVRSSKMWLIVMACRCWYDVITVKIEIDWLPSKIAWSDLKRAKVSHVVLSKYDCPVTPAEYHQLRRQTELDKIFLENFRHLRGGGRLASTSRVILPYCRRVLAMFLNVRNYYIYITRLAMFGVSALD